MTKTKAQLRAEAVERLNSMDEWCDGMKSGADFMKALLWDLRVIDEKHVRDALIDLLTDDCGPCYACAKLAELVAENSQLRVKLADKGEDMDDKRVITSHNELFEALEEREADSREKLEADCEKLIDNIQERTFSGRNTGALRFQLRKLLDRQAAITEREYKENFTGFGLLKDLNDAGIRVLYLPSERRFTFKCDGCYWPSLAAQPDQKAYDRIAELQAKNDKLREKVKHQAEQLAEVQDALHKRNEEIKPKWEKQLKKAQKENAKLQAKVDELTAELERETLSACNSCAERIDLQADYDAIIAKCAELCALCGFTMVDASGEVVS